MSSTSSTYLPDWTIGGADVHTALPGIVSAHGSSAVIIGGRRAMAAAEPRIRGALEGSPVSVTGSFVAGDEATQEKADELQGADEVTRADVILAVGGGKMIDLCKLLSIQTGKALVTVPTIASTCAAVTRVGVIYHPDHSFSRHIFRNRPAEHTVIDTDIIARAPTVYLWAGIGDALSKQVESPFSSRGLALGHSDRVGVDISRRGAEPLFAHGAQALADAERGEASDAVREMALTILVTTGLTSVLVQHRFNSSFAHAVYNAHTTMPDAGNHLHGEIVSLGVLVLLTLDGQFAERDRFHDLNASLGLPTRTDQVSVGPGRLDEFTDRIMDFVRPEEAPYPITRAMVHQALLDLNAYSAAREAERP
ncbi:iron-containing alcohol dehydrogenase family protein [Propionibacterium acidifaciens]|uniref:iron-containing alcohol dehydrogenase family protein n=1 Tax=Propionibacterium acidifaciens TaxID=556499 RepID=UPI0028DD1AB9|nr:iron-containing alcohol dehydrogenase family protein [Propionibacterium acidifaciens]